MNNKSRWLLRGEVDPENERQTPAVRAGSPLQRSAFLRGANTEPSPTIPHAPNPSVRRWIRCAWHCTVTNVAEAWAWTSSTLNKAETNQRPAVVITWRWLGGVLPRLHQTLNVFYFVLLKPLAPERKKEWSWTSLDHTSFLELLLNVIFVFYFPSYPCRIAVVSCCHFI